MQNRFSHLIGVVLVGALLVTATAADARTIISKAAAMQSVFGTCAYNSKIHYLMPEQQAKLSQLFGGRTRLMSVVEGRCSRNSATPAVAYVDVHRVRTLSEQLLVVVGLDGKLVRVEVLTFNEPLDYKPSERWYRLFDDKRFGSEIKLKTGIPIVTGATLTSRATAEAVRRVLQVHQILYPTSMTAGSVPVDDQSK